MSEQTVENVLKGSVTHLNDDIFNKFIKFYFEFIIFYEKFMKKYDDITFEHINNDVARKVRLSNSSVSLNGRQIPINTYTIDNTDTTDIINTVNNNYSINEKLSKAYKIADYVNTNFSQYLLDKNIKNINDLKVSDIDVHVKKRFEIFLKPEYTWMFYADLCAKINQINAWCGTYFDEFKEDYDNNFIPFLKQNRFDMNIHLNNYNEITSNLMMKLIETTNRTVEFNKEFEEELEKMRKENEKKAQSGVLIKKEEKSSSTSSIDAKTRRKSRTTSVSFAHGTGSVVETYDPVISNYVAYVFITILQRLNITIDTPTDIRRLSDLLEKATKESSKTSLKDRLEQNENKLKLVGVEDILTILAHLFHIYTEIYEFIKQNEQNETDKQNMLNAMFTYKGESGNQTIDILNGLILKYIKTELPAFHVTAKLTYLDLDLNKLTDGKKPKSIEQEQTLEEYNINKFKIKFFKHIIKKIEVIIYVYVVKLNNATVDEIIKMTYENRYKEMINIKDHPFFNKKEIFEYYTKLFFKFFGSLYNVHSTSKHDFNDILYKMYYLFKNEEITTSYENNKLGEVNLNKLKKEVDEKIGEDQKVVLLSYGKKKSKKSKGKKKMRKYRSRK